MNASDLKLRRMTAEDIEVVSQIEKDSFPEPYNSEIIKKELTINCAQLWIAEIEGQVIGYIDYWSVHDEIELITVAVFKKYRGQGMGEKLMQQMIDFAQKEQVHIIYLDVRESNLVAQNLYQKLGFKQVGLRKRYYKNNKENALIMVKELE